MQRLQLWLLQSVQSTAT